MHPHLSCATALAARTARVKTFRFCLTGREQGALTVGLNCGLVPTSVHVLARYGYSRASSYELGAAANGRTVVAPAAGSMDNFVAKAVWALGSSGGVYARTKTLLPPVPTQPPMPRPTTLLPPTPAPVPAPSPAPVVAPGNPTRAPASGATPQPLSEPTREPIPAPTPGPSAAGLGNNEGGDSRRVDARARR